MIFLAITVASSAIYCHTNSNNHTYAQEQLPNFPVGVKIISPAKDQKVPAGELEVTGISTDNATTDCQVYVDLNDIKPMQNTTATGASGQNDYSDWTFTYTNKYHLISEGINELTAKLSCINNPANVTKYYSVNVTGVATPLVAINNTTTTIAPTSTSNATITKNETQQTTTTMTTMENNETQVSPDTANQTQQQTPQTKPKPALQPELSTSSVQQQPLNQTQSQQEEPAVAGEEEEEEPTTTKPTPTHEPKEKAVAGEEEEEEPTTTKPANEDSQAAVEICDNTLDDDDDGLVDTEDTEDCPVAETPEEPAVAEEQKEQEQKEQEQKEQEKKQPITDSQKEGSFTSEEFVPLDESSTGSDIISEEPKETKGTELTEPATSDDAYDKEQIEQEEPLEDELRPLERQEVPLEMIERQPLEQNQSLEILEDQQPIEEQPVQTFNKEEEQPLQPGIQPLEQQPLEEQQPLQTFDRQQLSPIQQQQPLEQQPLEQQLIIEQQVPESPAGKQQQEEKRSINQVQEHHSNGDNMPFILPFDSQDVISAN